MNSDSFSNQQQEQIYRRLHLLVGPGAAAFYRDACRLMETEPPLESTTHLIGHLLREIESSLRAVLKPVWEPSVQPLGKKGNSSGDTQKTQILSILQALKIPESSDVAQTWLSLPGKESDYGLHKQAHRDDLAPPRFVNEQFRQFWKDIQAVLDKVLDRFETRYFDIRHTLDELLTKSKPDDKDIDKLRLHIPNSFVALGYFFEHLQSPEWLNPLWKKGFFKNPVEPVVNVENSGIRFLYWAQSRYLMRMASQDPQTVLNIAVEIVETGTKNISVHEDLAEAALLMPPELAASWVEIEIEWLKAQDFIYPSLPEKLGKLIAYLAKSKQVNVALKLSQELLAVFPPPISERRNSIEISIRCEEYDYQAILVEDIPELLASDSENTLHLLCKLLSHALELVQLPHKKGTFEDYSYNWYNSFEQNQNLYDVKSFLIFTIWKAVLRIAEDNPTQIRFLIQTLEGYHWRIFNRMALHLLCKFPNEAQDLIAERLVNQQLLNEPISLNNEYVMLLRENFAVLAPELQETIFRWIEQGPEDTSWIEEDKITAYIQHWQRNWLSIVESSLPAQWQQYYKQLVEQIGTADVIPQSGGNISRVGTVSPKSIEELAAMNVAELTSFLKEWQPTGELLAPSHDGLGMELYKIIVQSPQEFISEIEQFKQLHPAYREWLLRALNNALSTQEQQQTFLWLELVNFCSWLLERQPELTMPEASLGKFNWEWDQICDAVVSLINSGLQPIEQNEIPIELRSQVWQLLEQLTEDPKVKPGFDTNYDGSNMRPYEASVNTVRGKAMQAVFEYTSWLLKHTNKQENQQEQKVQCFDVVPEVRELLERHLNPEYDPSLTIRSVYGQQLPYLMSIDPKWTVENLEHIFPKDELFQELRHAAWEGYITCNQPDSDFLKLLQEEYNHVVVKMNSFTPEVNNHRSRAEEGLTAHLLDFYWHGELELDNGDNLLKRFFINSSAHNREEFMRQISWRIRHGKFEIGTDLLKRLQKFWEWRVSEVVSKATINSQASELRYFSWWFASGKFDDKWAISQLINTLKLVKALDYDKELLNYLVSLVPSMPYQVVNCLNLMAEANGIRSHNWFIVSRQEKSRTILRALLQCENEETRIAAKELINRLSARGIADFHDLLLDG